MDVRRPTEIWPTDIQTTVANARYAKLTNGSEKFARARAKDPVESWRGGDATGWVASTNDASPLWTVRERLSSIARASMAWTWLIVAGHMSCIISGARCSCFGRETMRHRAMQCGQCRIGFTDRTVQAPVLGIFSSLGGERHIVQVMQLLNGSSKFAALVATSLS